MSTVKANSHQVGQSVTAANNFTLYQPTTPDGTVRLGVGNAGATTADVITASATGVTIPSVSSSNTFGFKNRIINGGMVIDQRNAGGSVTPTAGGTYTLDRWGCSLTQASKYSVQQVASSAVGFIKALKVTSLSAYSIVATDIFAVQQPIEGLNIADLGWGTSSAKTVILSFVVQSSLTGTFGGSIVNGSFNRSYPFTYTVSVANTDTQISVTIPGDTSGTWATDNSIGLLVYFGLGVGSTYSATAGAWAGSGYFSATGATSVIGTNGATFYITGVQLEVGSQATSFDFRSYGQELALCQRYYQTISAAPGITQNGTTTVADLSFTFRVDMRATPTATPAGAMKVTDTAADFTQSSASISSFFGNVSGGRAYLPNFTGLTSLRSCFLRTDSPVIQLSAEL